MKKRTIYIGLFLVFIIGLISLIGTFAVDTTITEGNSSKADYLFNIVLGDRTNREIVIPSYDSKIVDIKISNPNEFNMSYLLYLEGINSNISIINISDTNTSGILNSKNTNIIKVFIQNNSNTDITVSIKDLVGFEKETLSVPSNATSINKGAYYKSIVKSNNNTYGKVKPNIKLSTSNGTVKYNLVPNTGYQYKSTTCNGTVSNNILTISNITSNISCEVVFEPIKVQVNLDADGGNYNVSTTYTEVKEHTYTVPYTGTYQLEAWGASGNNNYNSYIKENPSYAGYTSGVISLSESEVLYLYVGGQGATFNCCTTQGTSAGSGGASDIRLVSGNWNDTTSLASRIMVAGGAGGSYADSTAPGGGSAGGLTSYAVSHSAHPVASSTQTAGGTAGRYGTAGGFGYGGVNSQSNYNSGAGGYYGGGSGPAGGGGTSYISGHTGCVAITSQSSITPKSGCTTGTSDTSCSLHYSGKVFTNTVMIDGLGYSWSNTKDSLQQMPNPSGGYYASGIGNSGNGAIRITLLTTDIYRQTYTYNTKYSSLPTPTKDGYIFDGWYTEPNGQGTKITKDTVLSNNKEHTLYAYWLRNVSITYNYGYNLFTISSNSMTHNGLTITYDPDTSYLTMSGTPTDTVIFSNSASDLTLVEGDIYETKLTYISGNINIAAGDYCFFVTDVIDSSNSRITPRNNSNVDVKNETTSSTFAVSSLGASNGKGLEYVIWFKTPSKWSLTNYKTKVEVSKIETKKILYNSNYGTQPAPTRTDYMFDGWYTKPNGQGTKIADNTALYSADDHTLYAKWTPVYYLDLNGYLDGEIDGGLGEYGTADVYINGVLVCNDCTDYYTQHPVGTTYLISDIKATAGHTYNGVYRGQLSGTITDGETKVFLSFSKSDSTKPTCTLSANASTISATASDDKGIAYQGWDSSYSGTNSTSKSIAIGTHTYYVKDTSNNTNTCSITIAATTKSSAYEDRGISHSQITGSCGCITSAGKVTSCSCTGYGASCSSGSVDYSSCADHRWCDAGEELYNNNLYCRALVTTYTCSSGYTKINDNYCYK